MDLTPAQIAAVEQFAARPRRTAVLEDLAAMDATERWPTLSAVAIQYAEILDNRALRDWHMEAAAGLVEVMGVMHGLEQSIYLGDEDDDTAPAGGRSPAFRGTHQLGRR